MKMKHHFLACIVGMVALPAWAQFAVIAGPGAPDLNKDKLANGYLGRSFDFKPLDLPEDSATREAFYKKVTDREPSQIKAVWARVVFTGKGQAPLVLPNADAVKKAVISDPKAVGYIEKSAVDGSVKVLLSID